MSAITSPQPQPVGAPGKGDEPAPPRLRRPWNLLILLAVLASAAVAAYIVVDRRQQAAQAPAVVTLRTVAVTVGPMERIARLNGITSSSEFFDVKAPIMRGFESGRDMVLQYLVPSGAMVKKGDKIYQIDMQWLRDHIDDMKDDVERAEADIKKRRAEQSIDFENLMQSLRVAKSEYEKVKLDASAAEVRTIIDQELLKLGVEEAEARYSQLQKDVAQKQIAHKAELRILDITKQRHVRHMDRHVSDLTRYTVTSPMEGMAVVQSTFRGGEWSQVQVGDQVRSGQMVVKIVNPTKMQVDASINQAESGQFRIGQKARITLDAFPGVVLPGSIYSIGAIATGGWRQQFYIRNVPVRVLIEANHPNLIPDLSAGVNVVLDQVEKAVQIPLAAVFPERGKTVVYVRRGQSYEKREVALGLKNTTHAQVLGGLQGGEQVALERP